MLLSGYLIKLLLCQADFSNNIALTLGEEIIEHIVVSNYDNVTNLVEIEISTKAIRLHWLLLIVKLAVYTVKNESIAIVNKTSLTNVIHILGIL